MKGTHHNTSRPPDNQFTDYDTPDEYVRANRETLIEVIKHGSTDWVRALALAAFVEYGGEPDREQLRREIERMNRLEDSE
ncbi:hypothetical protein [Halorhabdus sp. CUG00001]|uniref:hypothetical protein n=1 Tax=Halorhabdus sp. CUG00001 TaxID=2600297 RepID=UPI00131CB72E|nr:hypothetical protein [Halorhabdus sp. CUG00001]